MIPAQWIFFDELTSVSKHLRSSPHIPVLGPHTQILVRRWGPEQEFRRCFADGLNQSQVSSVAQAECVADIAKKVDRLTFLKNVMNNWARISLRALIIYSMSMTRQIPFILPGNLTT